MQITGIENYKGKIFTVSLDVEKKVNVHHEVILEHDLKIGSEIDLEELKKIMKESDLKCAWERALNILDQRDHSYTEMYNKLERTFSSDVCYETLQKLVELGKIDDRRYAKELARIYIEVKHYGVYKATYEMQSRGLDKELIEQSLALYEKLSPARLEMLIERKYAPNLTNENGEIDDMGVIKVRSALMRQGFPFEQVNNAIDKYLIDTIGVGIN